MQAIRQGLATALAITVMGGMAVAHHGWSWAEAELTTLAGTVASVSMAPPHPSIALYDAEGQLWQVELGNPGRTSRAGFGATTVAPGDPVTVLGNRSLDPAERVIKAVRVTVGDRAFDMYPERIPAN